MIGKENSGVSLFPDQVPNRENSGELPDFRFGKIAGIFPISLGRENSGDSGYFPEGRKMYPPMGGKGTPSLTVRGERKAGVSCRPPSSLPLPLTKCKNA